MKVQLLYPDREFPWETPLTIHQRQAASDLELGMLLEQMSAGDPDRYASCQQVLLAGLEREEDIRYRQAIVRDLLTVPWIMEELTALLRQLHEREGQIRRVGLILAYPTSMVSYSTERLEVQLESLNGLRDLCRRMAECVTAPGLLAFADRAERLLTDDFFVEAAEQLKACRLKQGCESSFTLGPDLKPRGFVPEPPPQRSLSELRTRIRGRSRRYGFSISENDCNGMKALSELEQKSINAMGNVLMQTSTHVAGFFAELEQELCFYEGCRNLALALRALGCPLCLPEIGPWQYEELWDSALALQRQDNVTGNSHRLGQAACVVITGANQGGKTTFLRSMGQAVCMEQAGMFTAARRFSGPVVRGLYTHFRREEDRTLQRGKLEEELQRMDRIVDEIRPGSCLLMNESFAATNEADGSEIGWQVMEALLDQGVQIFCVTHFYELARRLQQDERALFLRARRESDGTRTYRLTPGVPTPTGHGQDLYHRIFGTD